jgi:hypothetical protein
MNNTKGLRRVLVAIGIIACSLHSLAETGSRTITATVCAICDDPKAFSGKVISVAAEYNSDGIERAVVTDPKCYNVGIAISIPRHFKGEAEFLKAVQQGQPGTLDKKVTGTFVGRFTWHPHDAPTRILELTEVRDLSVTMK